MSKSVFLTYATGPFVPQARQLCRSARDVGFDEVRQLSDSHLVGSSFWESNQGILQQPRGAGYWIWKPYIIAEALRSLENGDVLLYCDAGRDTEFSRFPSALVEQVRASEKGFLAGWAMPEYGPLTRWTKRDCLTLMDCDSREMLSLPQIQPGWSVWTPTDAAFEFLALWLSFSCDPRCSTDDENTLGLPNYEDFVDHRHDQSISTLLAHRLNAPFIRSEPRNKLDQWLARRLSSRVPYYSRRPEHGDAMVRGKSLTVVKCRAFLRRRVNATPGDLPRWGWRRIGRSAWRRLPGR